MSGSINQYNAQAGPSTRTRKRKGKVNKKNVVSKVVKLQKQIKKSMKSEVKSVDLPFTGTYLDDGGALFLLSRPGVGSNAWQREGQQINALSAQLRLNIVSQNNAVTVRCILFRDKFSNSVAPASATGVIRAVDGAGATTTTAQPYYPISTNVVTRYKILWDGIYHLKGTIYSVAPGPTDLTYQDEVVEKVYKKLNKTRVRWINTFTATGDIPQEGAIYLFVSSNIAAASANANKAQLFGCARFNFVDS